MKKFKFFERPAGARTVYIMAGVSFCLAVLAVAIFYSKTVSRLEDNLTVTKTTYQAGRNQQGETDPRYSESTTQTKPVTTTAEVTVSQREITTEPIAEITESAVNATTTTEKEKQSFMLPCDGEVIRKYSPEVPVYCETMEDWRTHSGVDFLVKEDEEVLSVGKGKVSKVLVDSSYGYTVEVDYGEFTARYCGLEQGTCVGIDQLLNKGDSIGKVGDVPCEIKSGRHLHFEIVKDGDYVDPMKMLKTE